jgi:hypothetical protein
MSEATSKYKPDLQPQTESVTHSDELRLLSINQARNILHIKYDDMKKLITTGKVRYVIIEGKIKIPYFELKEFLQNNLIRNTDTEEKNSRKAEIEINNIINKYKKSYGNNIRT